MSTKQEGPYTMETEKGGPKQGHSLLYRWTGPTGHGPWQNWPPNLDVLNAAFAAGRSVPSEYVMSRDYSKLYDHLEGGGKAIGYVHYKRSGGKPDTDSLCSAKRMPNGTTLLVGGDVQEVLSLHPNAFKEECTRLSLEWLAVPSPVGQEPVAWMSEDGKSFVEAWAHDQWVSTGGPTAEFFLPRYPVPLVRLSPKP